jgi:hypothetical protein
MVTGLVVVYDGACGSCSEIAARLSGVLVPRVLTRSCRDPHLTVEFPVLAGHLGERRCDRPLMVVLRSDGPAEVASGLAMVWRAASLVAPRRRLAAIQLALRILWVRRRPVT